MIKERADTGLQRIGGDPLFKPGAILDAMRSDDGTIVDVSFSYPEQWTLAKGPNLDVRDIKTSDSAFVLVAPLPKGKTSVAELKPARNSSIMCCSSIDGSRAARDQGGNASDGTDGFESGGAARMRASRSAQTRDCSAA